MKRKNILDSSALLRFLNREQGFEIVKNLLEKALDGKEEVLLSLINLGEVYYVTQRHYGQHKAKETVMLLEKLPINFVPVTKSIVLAAAELKAADDLPFVDAICAATAMAENAIILTSDMDLKKVKDKVSIVWV